MTGVYTAKVLIILTVITILIGFGIVILVLAERRKNTSKSPSKPTNVTIWNLMDSSIYVNGAGLIAGTRNVTVPLNIGDTISYMRDKTTVSYVYDGSSTVLGITPTLVLVQSQLTNDCLVANYTSDLATFQITDGSSTWSINILPQKSFAFIFPIGYSLLFPGEGNASLNIPDTLLNLAYYAESGYVGESNQFGINVIPITNNYSVELYMYTGGYDPNTGNVWLGLPAGNSLPVYIPTGNSYINITGYDGQNVVLTTDTKSDPKTHIGTFFPMSILNTNYVVNSNGITQFDAP